MNFQKILSLTKIFHATKELKIITAAIRTQIKKLKDSDNFLERVLFYSIYFFWSIFKFLINPRYRSEQITRIRYAKEIIQVSTFTKEDRYPILLRNVAAELKHINKPKILSFGCSTGEEVFSLKRLLPNAVITGVDINPWCIKTAKKHNHYSYCSFIHALDENWNHNNYYDCILALAVFQKTSHRKLGTRETTQSFNFEFFESTIKGLDVLLKIQGLMALDHSDYHFTDMELSRQKYTAIEDSLVVRSRPSFDKNNKKNTDITRAPRIFRKVR